MSLWVDIIALSFALGGVGIAFRGYWIYETYVALVGFLVGLVFGFAAAAGVSDSGILVLLSGIVFGSIGAGVALALERVLVATGGFISGLLLGSLLFGVNFGNFFHPLVVLLGLGGGLLAWKFHKLMIVVVTAFFGAVITSLVLTIWAHASMGLGALGMAEPFSVWFGLVFLLGIAIQFGIGEASDEAESLLPDGIRSELDLKPSIDEDPICPECGQTVDPDMQYCTNCGASLSLRIDSEDSQLSDLTCESCGEEITDDWEYCLNCGASLDTNSKGTGMAHGG